MRREKRWPGGRGWVSWRDLASHRPVWQSSRGGTAGLLGLTGAGAPAGSVLWESKEDVGEGSPRWCLVYLLTPL